MGRFDVHDLRNKVDVGSHPGTMWSLSSQKPGHGLVELRDPDPRRLWQSDGLLPHLINVQFARRTALTHVSLFMDFKEDDSYTPSKVRILAGTHFHDLVEVRTRELKEPTGWKHFILDNFGGEEESDRETNGATGSDTGSSSDEEQGSDAWSSASSSSYGTTQRAAQTDEPRQRRHGQHHTKPRRYLRRGVSKHHPPIHAFLLQISILSNHAAGKDTHIRGIYIFGPPTVESRQRAIREMRQGQEKGASDVIEEERQRDKRRRIQALDGLRRWAMETDGDTEEAVEVDQSGGVTMGEDHHGPSMHMPSLSNEEIPTTQRLNILSGLR